MEGGGGSYRVRTAEDLFRDYKGRRSAMIKALTDDFEAFYRACDPEKENMCLYGFPDGIWQVTLPAEEVPTELPEPALGINFGRDAMDRIEWLTMVATYSDSWLLSVAFYFAARFGFTKQGRKELFTLINSVPTVYEVVRRNFSKLRAPNSSSRIYTSNSKVQQPEPRGPKNDFSKQEDNGVENEEDEHEDTLCGACGQNYSDDPFWICCDLCEQWYHGKCVKITPARADHIKQYKCPACSGQKRG